MKKLLIEGWRGVSHSFAMVNQHQALAWARLGDFAIHHHDLPYRAAHWNSRDISAGFADADARFLGGLQDLPAEQADLVYRISGPIQAPPAPGLRAMAMTFAVTEFGLDPRSFADPQATPQDYTRGRNLVVTPSRWSRDRLLDYGFPETGVRVVGHGVDTTAFYPLSTADRQLNRSNLGFDADDLVFLNVGAPSWNKGVDLVVEAFARVHRQRPRTRLILKDASRMYGVSCESIITDMAARHPELVCDTLRTAITVVPGNLSQAELRLLYGVSDWYVSPYRAEGFNLPVLEALACGKPVIVSSGGATDDFCHGDAVRRVPTSFHRGVLGERPDSCRLDPHLPSLVDSMLDAVARGPDRQDLVAAAVARAELHSWRRAALALTDLARQGDVLPPAGPAQAGAAAPATVLQALPARAMHIYCDGGFGNRFNTLVSGLILARQAGLRPVVVWPRNNWCGAGFSELFENRFDVIERELVTYVPERDKFQFFMTEDHLGMGVPNLSPLQADSCAAALAYLGAGTLDVYYHTPLMPTYLDQGEVLALVRTLKLDAGIQQTAASFVARHALTDFLGIQIRRTDFGARGADDQGLFELVRGCPQKQFFVCSDDAEVERQFSQLPNVAVNAKNAYVEKMVDGDWNSVTLDHSGRPYACNVVRSAQSVRDAVVDLMVLARSQIVRTSNSTFLNTALLLQAAAA
ncbi:MAG: glycosyltransferase [Aquabacterium sp.]|nr:glycosyltransferase [Aquabacterium sp.]